MIAARFLALSLGAGVAMLSADASAVTRKSITQNGIAIDLFSWKDSKGLPRSVSLKKQGAGNTGNGGYAVRIAYRITRPDGSLRTIVADAPKNDGFGYFVSHERYRAFADGSESPIAGKIFGKDDSPLGRGFPVTTTTGVNTSSRKSIRFALSYPRYGTKAAGGIDQNTGQDKPKLGTDKSLFALYQLPVTIEWIFQDGRDHPRIVTTVDLSKLPGPDRASFDLRGPYGKLDFDDGDNPIAKIAWADRFRFFSTGSPLTRNSDWTWNQTNSGARFIAITAAGLEMGLVEPRTYPTSPITDGFAFGRGGTSATHSTANAGCPDQELPCDYEWPYQATNYELPYDNPNAPAFSEKLAWGSTPFYGTSLPSSWDGGAARPLNGFPASKKIVYDVCVVLGPSGKTGLTRAIAQAGGTYACASAD